MSGRVLQVRLVQLGYDAKCLPHWHDERTPPQRAKEKLSSQGNFQEFFIFPAQLNLIKLLSSISLTPHPTVNEMLIRCFKKEFREVWKKSFYRVVMQKLIKRGKRESKSDYSNEVRLEMLNCDFWYLLCRLHEERKKLLKVLRLWNVFFCWDKNFICLCWFLVKYSPHPHGSHPPQYWLSKFGTTRRGWRTKSRLKRQKKNTRMNTIVFTNMMTLVKVSDSHNFLLPPGETEKKFK